MTPVDLTHSNALRIAPKPSRSVRGRPSALGQILNRRAARRQTMQMRYPDPPETPSRKARAIACVTILLACVAFWGTVIINTISKIN